MFPTNYFPHHTSTFQVFPNHNSFINHEKDDLYITNPNKSNNPTPFLSSNCFPDKEQCDKYDHVFWSEVKKDKAPKKDHHSKIHTAQGPRDRRVRLSVEVARKFFYLQDLLGVDKASKTLDWLFNKSKISIDELIKSKKETSSTTVTDRSEVVFQETGSDEESKVSNKGKRKKVTRKYKSGVNQLRADARARARERTKEKMKLDNKSKSFHVDCCSSNRTPQTNNLDVSNDSSSKFTDLAKFTDLHEQLGGSSATI